MLPLVPGREAVGVVLGVGSAVKGVVLGQRVLASLGNGLDAEAEDDGADRSARDDLTIGAATHRLRVPARYALPLPASLPTAAATGLLGAGGAAWAALHRRRLPKGAKVAVLGGGTAGTFVAQLARSLGHDAYRLGDGPEPPALPASSRKRKRAATKYLDCRDQRALRLHEGAFDVVLCVSGVRELEASTPTPLPIECPSLNARSLSGASADATQLAQYLPFVKRGGALLLCDSHAALLSVSPRVLQAKSTLDSTRTLPSPSH